MSSKDGRASKTTRAPKFSINQIAAIVYVDTGYVADSWRPPANKLDLLGFLVAWLIGCSRGHPADKLTPKQFKALEYVVTGLAHLCRCTLTFTSLLS